MALLKLNSLLWGLLLISTTVVTDANTLEDVQVKLYKFNLRASNSETQKTLKKADLVLESYGFNRGISTTKLVKEPGSYEPEYQESYFYYKIVNCSRTQEIERELDTLIPDIFADEANTKLKEEKYISHLGDMRQCKVGLELILKKTKNHYGSKKASPQSKIRSDVDKIEAADEGGFRINSGIGFGKTINNIWGSRRRSRNTIPTYGARRRRWGR